MQAAFVMGQSQDEDAISHLYLSETVSKISSWPHCQVSVEIPFSVYRLVCCSFLIATISTINKIYVCLS